MQGLAKDIARTIYYFSPPFVQRAARRFIPGERLFMKYLRELEESQWFSPQELEELQSEKLRRIIHHAYENVPYYRRVFDERGLKPKDIECQDDLKKLPILTKDDVRQHFEELQAKDIERYRPTPGYTGGSTGKPLKFYNDKVSDLVVNAFVWRFRRWAQYGATDRQVIMRYKTDFPPVKKGMIPHLKIGNILYLSAFHLKDENFGEYINRIRKFQPKTIWSFPSTLYVLARYIEERGIPPIASLKSITTSSETLFPHFRKIIEESFGAKVYDWYGSNEGVVNAGECPNSSLHINSEYGVLEVVDSDGKSLPPGEPGIIIGTSFNKFAMPFIRYELGDVAVLSDMRCLCGRGLPVIASLEGRLDDLIITKDGRFIGRLDEAFHESFGIKMSQIVQEEVGKIVVRIVKGQGFLEDDIRKLDTQLRQRLGEEMDIEYRFVEDIERVGTGKYRFVLSKLDVAKLYPYGEQKGDAYILSNQGD